MAKAILTLDSLADRPVVVIDGTEYRLLTNNTIPPLDAHRFWKGATRIQQLVVQETLTEAEEAELAALPNRCCRLVLKASDDVHAKLDDIQRMDIIEAFLQPPRPEPQTESGATAASSIGETRLPVSSGSTEATH